MHFKIGFKRKETVDEEKKSGKKWHFFFFLNQTFSLPFFVVLENGTLLSAAFMYRWRDGWKSASERPIWSAFNGLDGKARERGIVPFFLLFGRVLFLEVFSGIFHRADFFDFLWLCLLYMNCFCGTRRLPRPPLFSLSWICLISRKQNGGSWPSYINSESLRGWGLDSEGRWQCRGGLILRSFLCFFFALFWPCFSPRTLYFVALRTLLRMSLIFQRSLSTPLSSQKCPPYTSDKHTIWILSFISRSDLKPQPPTSARTQQLFLTTFDGQLFGPVEVAFKIGRENEGKHRQDLF